MPYVDDRTGGYKRMETSYDAAKRAAPRAKRRHDEILTALLSHGPLTADETAEAMGASVLSIRPRISEMAESGSIEDTGVRRKNASGRSAAVWRAVK